jgi:hypothetical protein
MPTIRVDNFGGGITDDTSGANPTQAEELENLYITQGNKLARRNGFQDFISDLPTADAVEGIWLIPNQARTNDAANGGGIAEEGELLDKTLFVATSTKIYYRDSHDTAWGELLFPSGNSLVKASEAAAGKRLRNFKALRFGNLTVITSSDAGTRDLFEESYESRTVLIWRYRYTGVVPAIPRWTMCLATPPATSMTYTEYASSYSYIYASVLSLRIRTYDGTYYYIEGPIQYRSTTSKYLRVAFDTDLSGDFYPIDSLFGLEGVKATIYRTNPNGQVLYQIYATYYSPTVSIAYTDTEDGADVSDGALLYTEGGEYENEEIAASAISAITSNGVLWTVLGKTQFSTIANKRVIQAKPNNPFGLSEAVSVEFPSPVTAIGTVGYLPIVCTIDKIFRVEGVIDAVGAGSHRVITISESVGCLHHDSMVQVDNMLYFAAADGFYRTNGYQVQPISTHIKRRYAKYFNTFEDSDLSAANYNRVGPISAVFDNVNRVIYWVSQTNTNSTNPVSNNKVFVAYPDKALPDGNIAFSTISISEDYQTNIMKLGYAQKQLFAGTNTGKVLVLNADTSEGTQDGNTLQTTYDKVGNKITGIYWRYKSTPASLGTELNRKWYTRLFATFDTQFSDTESTKISCNINSYNDYKPTAHPLTPIREYDDPAPDRRLLTVKRHFPANTLRATYKQIEFEAGTDVVQFNSDTHGLASVNGDTVILNVGYVAFPISPESSPLSYDLYLATESYATPHRIINSSADTLVLQNTTGLTLADEAWVIRGIARDEKFKLENYTAEYTPLEEGYDAYSQAKGGENA